ncbi:uncharacterized protein TRUGW13939_08727 [Talaromyces rugulosus]|uniref:Rhodopsin domain-containing protein n=1 Tax=Talaromyces rugulosus TaxID=121627 RepID=A0A7H8R7H8_TALRU|nr:uncharacterized protein TRUGW13939_08727 [Talaromyces rugulosus]QKX61575.1 hypothetical protein TRUGW13939_08727 [Talaromyces rugulosus]
MSEYSKLPFAFITPSEVLAAAIVLPLLCIFFIAVRFYVRHIQKQEISVDDWMGVVAMLLIIGMGVCLIIGAEQHVMGYAAPLPEGFDPQEAYQEFLGSYEKEAKIEFYYQLLMIVAYGFIKLSLVFFYRRLFFVIKWSTFDIVSLAYIAIICMWTLAFFLLFLFACKSKIYLHWAPLSDVENQCGDPLAPELGLVISDLITDLMVLALPLPIIWRLRVSTARKISITLVFIVGLIAIAASITRMAIYIIVSYRSFSSGYDIDQTVTTMLWWSMVEACLGLITSCLPVLSPLLRKVTLPGSLTSLVDRVLKVATSPETDPMVTFFSNPVMVQS